MKEKNTIRAMQGTDATARVGGARWKRVLRYIASISSAIHLARVTFRGILAQSCLFRQSNAKSKLITFF